MTTICFYISDYGYGHASRDIAIIRRLLNELKDIKIFVKTNGPFHFVKQSLPQKNVHVIQTKNDIGVIFNLKGNSVTVDRERTKKMLDMWMGSWDKYIQREKGFCRSHNVNLILSDISPQPFVVAYELGIPSIGISNFTWHYIFYHLFEDIPATKQIKEAYQSADIALALPFNEEMNIFKTMKEISLVSREITVGRYNIRKRCKISDDDLLVYVGVGRSFDPSYLRQMKNIYAPNVKILALSNTKLPCENAIKIPHDETETQNYIGMCDLVVSKTGYGTVSEAVKARIPMFLLKREGFKDDESIGREVEELGIGKYIPEQSFLNGTWMKELNSLDLYKKGFNNLDDRFKNDGTTEIVEMIKAYEQL